MNYKAILKATASSNYLKLEFSAGLRWLVLQCPVPDSSASRYFRMHQGASESASRIDTKLRNRVVYTLTCCLLMAGIETFCRYITYHQGKTEHCAWGATSYW